MLPFSFSTMVAFFSGLSTIIMTVLLLVKPLRNHIFGWKVIADGQKCQLRSDILRVYYNCLETRTIRQYERENLNMEYDAYKAMGGNSFIDDIYQEVKKWKVVA